MLLSNVEKFCKLLYRYVLSLMLLLLLLLLIDFRSYSKIFFSIAFNYSCKLLDFNGIFSILKPNNLDKSFCYKDACKLKSINLKVYLYIFVLKSIINIAVIL